MSASATLNRAAMPHGSSALRPPRRKRRWLRLALVVLLAVVLAGIGWLVTLSSVLAARHVAVTGVHTLTPDEVRATARVPLGIPLARQDVRGIAARVRTLRLVSSVTVTRTWPDTMTIAVRERKPVLALVQPDGFLLVDAGGYPFRTVSTRPARVVLTDVDPTSSWLLTQVGVVAAALPASLTSKVARIHALTPDGITLSLVDGDTVFWGSADNSELKSAVLTALLKTPARSYDVSAPHSPALR